MAFHPPRTVYVTIKFSTGPTRFLSLILTFALAVRALSSGRLVETQNQPASWTPELSMKVKAVGAVRVSPDGKRVVYTVNEPVMAAEKSEYLTNIWMANADGSDAYRMTGKWQIFYFPV